jgi:hypothetical protein
MTHPLTNLTPRHVEIIAFAQLKLHLVDDSHEFILFGLRPSALNCCERSIASVNPSRLTSNLKMSMLEVIHIAVAAIAI